MPANGKQEASPRASKHGYIDASRFLARSLLATVLLIMTSAALADTAAATEAPGQAEAGMASRIAGVRAAQGLPSLASAGDLQVVARRQAQRMADRGEPFHNANLGSEVQGWSIVSENVGVGSSFGQIHDAFMGSATHRSIILNPELTELGVGAVVSPDGMLWVVEVFRRPTTVAAAPAVPTPAPDPAPPTAPAPKLVPRAAAPAVPVPAQVATTIAPAPSTTAPLPEPVAPAPKAEEITGRSGAAAAIARFSISTAPTPIRSDRPLAFPGAGWIVVAGAVGLAAMTMKTSHLATLLH